MKTNKTQIKSNLKSQIAEYPNFPKEGITFKDLNPIYQNKESFKQLINYTADLASSVGNIDYICGIEARGFILGAGLAQKLDCGFIPMRKKGKLPGQVESIEYDLEYGTDILEIQNQDQLKNSRVLIIDDVFATGGPLKAAINLLKKQASYVACGIVMDIGIADIKSIDCDHFVILDDA